MEQGMVVKLVLQYLEENNFLKAAQALQEESGVQSETTTPTPTPEALPKTSDTKNLLVFGGALTAILNEHMLWSLEKEIAQLSTLDTHDDDNSKKEKEDFHRLLLHQARGPFVERNVNTLSELHDQNVLCVGISPVDTTLLASGSGDRKIQITKDYASETPSRIACLTHHSGPVLDLAWNPKNPSLLLSSSMDRSHAVVDITNPIERCQMFRDHTKFVGRVRWAPDGQHFATASHDSTINLYGVREGGNDFVLVHRMNFGSGPVEALDFIDNEYCVATKREDHRMYYINIRTFEVTDVNMNLLGDSHVSFTALNLAVSRSGRYVVAVTDKSRSIMFDVRSPKQVRNFFGADNDGFAMPAASFDECDSYLYCTSQTGPSIVCWDVAMQRMVHTINPYPHGHKQVVRCLAHHPSAPVLVSGSFDKTVKIWQPQL
eukprot:c3815_g1_i1.p1 GENE.c3815_g1_i1~~c3815_g1_i1.p1  ORF type:complete len:444 (+),score=118.24 c3815_g1_i1:39-1334(+)